MYSRPDRNYFWNIFVILQDFFDKFQSTQMGHFYSNSTSKINLSVCIHLCLQPIFLCILSNIMWNFIFFKGLLPLENYFFCHNIARKILWANYFFKIKTNKSFSRLLHIKSYTFDFCFRNLALCKWRSVRY